MGFFLVCRWVRNLLINKGLGNFVRLLEMKFTCSQAGILWGNLKGRNLYVKSVCRIC